MWGTTLAHHQRGRQPEKTEAGSHRSNINPKECRKFSCVTAHWHNCSVSKAQPHADAAPNSTRSSAKLDGLDLVKAQNASANKHTPPGSQRLDARSGPGDSAQPG